MLIAKGTGSDIVKIEKALLAMQDFPPGREWYAFLEAANIIYEEDADTLTALLTQLNEGNYTLLSEITERRNKADEQKLRKKLDTH